MITNRKTVVMKQSGNRYVALCLEVGVVGIGDTETEALRDLDEAAVMLISYLREEGREYELADRKVDPDRLRDFLWEEAEEEEEEIETDVNLMEVFTLVKKEAKVASGFTFAVK